MKGLKHSTVGNTVLRVVNSQQSEFPRARPCRAMGYGLKSDYLAADTKDFATSARSPASPGTGIIELTRASSIGCLDIIDMLKLHRQELRGNGCRLVSV